MSRAAGWGATAASALLLAVAALLAPPPAAHAHTRSLSYSSWEMTPSGARVRVRFPALEATRLPPETLAAESTGGDPLVQYVARRISLRAGGEPCTVVSPPRRVRAAEGWVAVEWRLACSAPGAPREITSRLFLDAAPSHLHFARAALPGAPARERVLSEEDPTWRLGPVGAPDGAAARDEAAADHARGSGITSYVALGVEHILSGWDHLAFVLALLLLAASLREVAGLVTSFTLAHSLTLAAATLGLVHPEPAVVEALIGFSIALVAAENAWLLSGRGRIIPEATTLALLALALGAALGAGVLSPLTLAGLAIFAGCHFALLRRVERPAALRAAVAFGFGLVHGFGFAGVLAEMELPRARLVPALFGFNVGVELGQLAVVAVAWPLLRALARPARGEALRWAAVLGSAAICGLGVFWFVTRTYA